MSLSEHSENAKRLEPTCDRVIYSGSKGNPGYWICFSAGSIAAAIGIITLCFAYDAWKSRQVEMLYFFLMFWIIVPPIWFWVEYFMVYRKYGDSAAFESFKHGQQLSLAIWAAFAFSLNGLAGAERFKEKNDPKAWRASHRTTVAPDTHVAVRQRTEVSKVGTELPGSKFHSKAQPVE